MTRLEPPATMNRRQPLLGEKESAAAAKEDRRRVGEVAGGTTAECAAVCCCCPFVLMNLLVLAVYKVPKGLCRKALKKNKRQRLLKRKAALLQQPQQQQSSMHGMLDESDMDAFGSDDSVDSGSTGAAVDFETEMWGHFHGGGFWRSPSQRGA